MSVTPSWSESQLIAPVKVAINSLYRAQFAIPTTFQANLYLAAGRLSASAPGSGIIIQLEQFPWYGSGPNRIPNANALMWQDNTTAGAQTAISSNTLLTGAQSLTVSGATNASPIVITTSAAHGLSTGDVVTIASVGGNTNANGSWVVTVTGSTTFSLNTSSGNSAYTSGGTVGWTNGVTVTSATGVAAGTTQQSMIMLADGNSTPSNCEFHRVSRVNSTNVYFPDPLTHVVTTSWYLSTYALVVGPISVGGGATAQSGNTNQVNFAVAFDNQNEGTVPYFCHAWLQQLNSIG